MSLLCTWLGPSPLIRLGSGALDRDPGVGRGGVDAHRLLTSWPPELRPVRARNGGDFLLVPLFALVLGLTAIEAAGTSMVVVGILTVPTLAAHWALGHIDWTVAAGFALGLIPASLVGARLIQYVPAERAREAFGLMLAAFSTWFLCRQLR